jgi:SAM-dependent methyltransferase
VVVDAPSGGGLALRALTAEQDVRYLAVDIDPTMLARTKAKARARGLRQVETVQADMRSLPLADASVDLLCSYSGLHMIADPQNAIAEFARVLKPGGRLLGSTFVSSGALRKRLLFGAGERRGYATPPRDPATVARLLLDAGLDDVEVAGDGFVLFSAACPPAQTSDERT